jgi:hypothetical protein
MDKLFMDVVRNPYAPGAGTPPPELAGRTDVLTHAQTTLLRIQQRRPVQSLILVGLRGVGKTVLLVRMREIAGEIGCQALMLEVNENRNLPSLLVPPLRQVLFRFNRVDAAKEQARRGLRVLRSFLQCFRLDFGDANVSVTIAPEEGTADSGDLEADLSELFSAVGEAAIAAGQSIVLLIDELQYLSEPEFSALIMALHRMNQGNMPIIMIGAGLPQIHGLAGASKSYAERLFRFPEIGALRDNDAEAALVNPANEEGVTYERAAIQAILRTTKRYPYFIQQWGYDVWNTARDDIITEQDVIPATAIALRTLDEGFFKVRFDRCTPAERRYLRAMAELGEGHHRSGDIADMLGLKVTSVGPTRSSLIKKGMIYSPQHGDNAFTVPLFDGYMKRAIPEFP